jgi:TetR/AcrR family transcriptional regulator
MTGARRARRKSPDDRRNDIVAAVLWLLAKGGASAVTTPAIARRVGVAQSAIFKHFRNKETMWRAVMDALALDVGSRLRGAASTEGPHSDRLFAIIVAYLTVVKDFPAVPALMFAEAGQLHGTGNYLREEITRRFGWFHGALEEQIKGGMQTGDFRADLDSDAAATLAAGIAQSQILRWQVSGRAIDLLGEARKCYPIFLQGIVSENARQRGARQKSTSSIEVTAHEVVQRANR